MSDQDVPSGRGADLVITGPAGFSPPGPEDLLGLRIAAALIDLAVLAGVLVILSAATGQMTTSSTSVQFSLNGASTVVFLAFALLYYFVLEAWAGQTLGKLLLNLRILHAGGARPSVRAVAVRTLLRVVDWLPLLYLAGFISTLASGARRQRIGDLAARTVMVRAARPARDRGLALLPPASVVLAAIVLPLSRSSLAGGTQTYQGRGVSFAYPAGWSVVIPHGTGTGNLLWSTAISPGTPHDAIVVRSYRLKIPVTAQNIGALVPALARLVQHFLGATLHRPPQKITMASLPAVQFHITGGPGGPPSQSTLLSAFNGTTEYFVNCQYTPALAPDVQQACNQVVSTFTVS